MLGVNAQASREDDVVLGAVGKKGYSKVCSVFVLGVDNQVIRENDFVPGAVGKICYYLF